MCVQDSEKALHNAVAAAKQYVKLKKECRDRHEAFIGVSVNGQDKHGVKIIIEDLHTLCSHNTNIFTPISDDISIINNTLQIKPKDSLFGLSVIEITAK